MCLLIDETNVGLKSDLLREFEKNLFNMTFPDDERESITDDIIPRIREKLGEQPQSFCVLKEMDDKVAGGMVVDWYPDCGALEIIYIVVDNDYRSKGIGKELIATGLDLIQQKISATGKSVKHIFLEVDIPFTAQSDSETSMDPIARVIVWEKYGARRIPINYVQPPLSPGKEPVDNMMLMCLSGHCGITEESISAEDLKDFLTDFYKGLNAAGRKELQIMLDEIDRVSKEETIRKIDLDSLVERPSASISEAAVTVHFSVDRNLQAMFPGKCMCFNSFECDLMNYQNQKERPFETKFVNLYKDVQLQMPACYFYTSEGIRHFRVSANKTLSADVSISISCPADPDYNNSVVHVTIRPSKEAFSNLDIIKLIKPFGSKQEEYCPNSEVMFKIGKNKPCTYGELLKMTLGDDAKFAMTGEGVSQFDISSVVVENKPEPEEYFAGIPTGKSIDDSLFNKVVCGLILGIFDYERMNSAEVEDTVRPVVTASDSFIVLSRGHLFKLEAMDDDDRKSLQRILISPYLLVPSAALCFSNLALDECRSILAPLDRGAVFKSITRGVKKAETCLNLKYLDNLFQYKSEKDIFREGERQRNMKVRLNSYWHRIDIYKMRAQKTSDVIIEGCLGMLAAFGAKTALSEPMGWSRGFILIMILLACVELFRLYQARK